MYCYKYLSLYSEKPGIVIVKRENEATKNLVTIYVLRMFRLTFSSSQASSTEQSSVYSSKLRVNNLHNVRTDRCPPHR